MRRQGDRALGIRFAGALLIASYATGVGAEMSDVWKIYSNARYGYSLCYPADLFHPGTEPDEVQCAPIRRGGYMELGFA